MKIISYVIGLSVLATITIFTLFYFLTPPSTVPPASTAKIVPESPMYVKIAKNFSDSHVYIRHVYACYEFSRDLVEIYKEAGYDAEIIQGDYDRNCTGSATSFPGVGYRWGGHAWVRLNFPDELVYIEATSGYEIPDEMFARCYRLTREGYYLNYTTGEYYLKSSLKGCWGPGCDE